MAYGEAIKEGFRLVNQRWQLVGVQVSMMLFNCLGFFVMVGIPLGIAFIIFGLDLTGLAQMKDIVGLFRNPAELLSKYFGLALLVLISFLCYIILMTTVGLFVFSGSVGMIGRSVLDPSLKFSLRTFFGEAKRLFFPLMWFSCFAGLIFIAIAFGLGILGSGIAAAVSAARSQDSTLALFLGIFFTLVLVLLACSVILAALASAVFGIAVLFFKGTGSVRSFREAARFLWDHQNAFWLYVMLFVGYVCVSFVVILIIYPFNLIPIIGTIIAFPFQIVSSAVQGYLGLVILAVIFRFYYAAAVRPLAAPSVPDGLPEGPIGGASSPAGYTSPAPADSPEPPPPPSEG